MFTPRALPMPTALSSAPEKSKEQRPAPRTSRHDRGSDSVLRLTPDSPAAAVRTVNEVLKLEASTDLSDLVRLNVGGVKYSSSRGTLCAVDGSYLAALFSGRWEPPKNEAGEVFIDRDGDAFRWVLGYLRAVRFSDPAVALPGDEATRRLLQVEAEFFGLPGLIDVVVRAGGGPGPVPGAPLLAAGVLPSTAAYTMAVMTARHVWDARKDEFRSDPVLGTHRDLLLHHLLRAPLDANVLELVQHLVEHPRPCLELTLIYCAFGDTRLELEAAFLTSSMPGWAPTSRPSSGPLAGPSSSANHLGHSAVPPGGAAFLMGTQGAAAVGTAGSSGGGMPWAPGGSAGASGASTSAGYTGAAEQWRAGMQRVKYASLRVRESSAGYAVETFLLGEELKVTNHAAGEFKEGVLRYTSLHKLLVQQSPRDKFLGLMHLLELEGLGKPRLSVEPHTYQVHANTFSTPKATLFFEPTSPYLGP